MNSLDIAKRLYIRFCNVYGDKFNKNHISDEFITMWCKDWSEGIQEFEPSQIEEAFKECKFNLEWPPSLAEFRKLCLRNSGIPSPEEVIDLVIRRDLSHPIVDMVYKKIGSWDFSHDKKDVLERKVKTAYREAIEFFRNKQIESKPKVKLEVLNNESHGSEVTRNQPRGNNMRNASEYLL